MNMSSQNCAVQVKIELGHRAAVKKIPSPEGFTHDWTVYVRGPENCNISYFIEKVVFNLHASFHNPKRVLTEPPYAVQEQGYAGFELPIDIYFKNKEDPKKIRFKYDLFLKLEDCPPVNHIRCEKLTFQNPTDEFKKKLLKAGGVLVGPTGEPMGQSEFVEIFDAPISLDGSKRPKSSYTSKEKPSKDKSSSSAKSSSKPIVPHSTSSTNSKDSVGSEERKEKRSPKDSSQHKRSLEPSSHEGAVLKKPKRPSSVSSPPEVKVKDKHRSSEKTKHSKEREGSKASKDSHKDHHRREVDSQEKDPRERDKEKLKREHKDRDGKKEVFKHKNLSSVTDSPNPLAQKSHSSEKKDKHGSKTSTDSVRKEIKQDSRKMEQKFDPSKGKKLENSHVRKENKEEKISSSSKSSSQKGDKKVESTKSSSKVPDSSKRPSLSTPETAPPKKKPKVEDLFSSSDDESSEDEDEDFVKAIIEGVERNIDQSESSESSSDSELDEAVLSAWSSPVVSKLSPLSQKVMTKSPSKNSSSQKTSRSFSPASEKSSSSKYSPTGSTHSHTSTSHKLSSSSVTSKEKDISKHSKESKSQKSSTKVSHSLSDKKEKESSHRSDKHASKRSSTPNVHTSTEKVNKHSKSHSKEKGRPEKSSHEKKPKDMKFITDIKSEKLESVPHPLEKTECKENLYKSENSKENVKNVKLEKARTYSIESNEQHFLKKEYLSDDDDIDKRENVTETFNFDNGYEHLGIAPNGEDLIELLKLHKKLESMQDTSIIQRVVQEIEKTGLYKISEKTFDFDLCELDSSTVKKIHNFLCSV